MEETLLLTDLIDISILQEMQNSFSKMTGIAAYITDADGNYVTGCSCQSDFCSRFTRSSPIGEQRCRMSDLSSARHAFHKGSAISYHCHAGLRCFAIPLIIDNQLIGCFLVVSCWTGRRMMPESAIWQTNLVSIRKNIWKLIIIYHFFREKRSTVLLCFCIRLQTHWPASPTIIL